MRIVSLLLISLSLLMARPLENTTRVLMGTFVTIKAPADASPHVQEAFGIMEAVDARFSTYREDSEVSRLNRGGTLIPSPELLELIAVSERLHKESGGAFDITVGAYTRTLYRFGEAERLPSDKELKAAVASVGFSHIHQESGTLRLDPGTRLDFGGIAKGYAVEKAAALLEKEGVTDFVIAASGDIFCKKQCEIAVTDPFNPEAFMATFTTALPHTSVTTSGNYRRFVRDEAHSHLLDPATGHSQQYTAGITLISQNANTLLDGLATAVSIMEKERGLKLLESHPGIAYLIVYTDGSTVTSPNLDRFVKNFRFTQKP